MSLNLSTKWLFVIRPAKCPPALKPITPIKDSSILNSLAFSFIYLKAKYPSKTWAGYTPYFLVVYSKVKLWMLLLKNLIATGSPSLNEFEL